MDVFKEFCKLSMKRATGAQYVIIALILHNHPGTEGALVLCMRGSKGVLHHQTCRKKKKRFPLHIAAPGEPQYLFQVELGMGLM